MIFDKVLHFLILHCMSVFIDKPNQSSPNLEKNQT